MNLTKNDELYLAAWIATHTSRSGLAEKTCKELVVDLWEYLLKRRGITLDWAQEYRKISTLIHKARNFNKSTVNIINVEKPDLRSLNPIKPKPKPLPNLARKKTS